jgi:hypothetical protein
MSKLREVLAKIRPVAAAPLSSVAEVAAEDRSGRHGAAVRELGALRATVAEHLAPLLEAVATTQASVDQARREIERAASAHAAAVAELDRAKFVVDRRRAELEREAAATADERIAQTLAWLDRAEADLQALPMFDELRPVERAVGPLRLWAATPVLFSNVPSWQRAQEAIRVARQAVADLRLVEVEDLEAVLDEHRARVESARDAIAPEPVERAA